MRAQEFARTEPARLLQAVQVGNHEELAPLEDETGLLAHASELGPVHVEFLMFCYYRANRIPSTEFLLKLLKSPILTIRMNAMLASSWSSTLPNILVEQIKLLGLAPETQMEGTYARRLLEKLDNAGRSLRE